MKYLIILLILSSCTKQMSDNSNLNIMAKGKPVKPPPVNNIPKPTGLTAIAVSVNQVNLSWNPVLSATTYWINRNGYVPAIIPGTSFQDKTLSPGTSYTYMIAAVVNSVLGPYSDPVTITTPSN